MCVCIDVWMCITYIQWVLFTCSECVCVWTRMFLDVSGYIYIYIAVDQNPGTGLFSHQNKLDSWMVILRFTPIE